MEKNKMIPLLLVLLQAGIFLCHICPRHPDKYLTCYNDFNHTINCVWNSTLHQTDHVCTLTAQYNHADYSPYGGSCDLEPVDVSRPAVKTCSVILDTDYIFDEEDELNISVSCDPIVISYRPSCHVKVNPGKPRVNLTIISWYFDHIFIKNLSYELQWKRQNQLWSNAVPLKQTSQKGPTFQELDEDSLIQGETYEARVRVMVSDQSISGPWGDWSPTTSWVSAVGKPKQPPALAVEVWQMAVAGVAVVALALVIVLFRTDKTTWVYIVKRIRGPPIPNPAKSFLNGASPQVWLNPHFTNESFQFFLKPIETATVEMISTVDAVNSCNPDHKMWGHNANQEPTGSNFANPNYSVLCVPPPLIFPLSVGNLEACGSDTPYGPVGSKPAGPQNPEGDKSEVGEKKVDILELFSKGNSPSESVVVISDYEKAEKLQFDRLRFQSLDSGVCSSEEVSQESLEADSITGHGEDPESDSEKDGGSEFKVDFQRLFGNCGGILGKGSIQVCSDYEAVQKLCSETQELPSPDPPESREGKEQVRREDTTEEEGEEEESTSLLIGPRPPGAAPGSVIPMIFTLPESRLNPALPPQQIPLLGLIAMATGGSVEPSGDGYMPVRQEQS